VSKSNLTEAPRTVPNVEAHIPAPPNERVPKRPKLPAKAPTAKNKDSNGRSRNSSQVVSDIAPAPEDNDNDIEQNLETSCVYSENNHNKNFRKRLDELKESEVFLTSLKLAPENIVHSTARDDFLIRHMAELKMKAKGVEQKYKRRLEHAELWLQEHPEKEKQQHEVTNKTEDEDKNNGMTGDDIIIADDSSTSKDDIKPELKYRFSPMTALETRRFPPGFTQNGLATSRTLETREISIPSRLERFDQRSLALKFFNHFNPRILLVSPKASVPSYIFHITPLLLTPRSLVTPLCLHASVLSARTNYC